MTVAAAAATYPYHLYLANTITGQVMVELPPGAQVSQWSRQLNGVGSLTVQVALSPRPDPDTMTMLREPWRWTVIYSYGAMILQAGLLVQVFVDDTQQPPTAQLTCMPLWDFLGKKRLAAYPGQSIDQAAADIVFGPSSPDLGNQNISWGSVVERLVAIATGFLGGAYNLPVVLFGASPGTATITYTASDLAGVGQRIMEITQQDGGPEVEMSPEWDDSNHAYLQWWIKVGTPRLGQLGYPHAWDYQQACQNLQVTIDGTNQANDVITKGQDARQTGGALTWAESTDTTYTSQGWPWLQLADTNHVSETSQDVITRYAVGDVAANLQPRYTGSMVVRVDGRNVAGQATGSPAIDAVRPGDTFFVQVTGHPSLDDGQYAGRILAMSAGQDLWTARLDVQVIGAMQ